MDKKKTLKAQLDPIMNYVDLGTISEDIWDRAYAIDERFETDNFSSEERERLCDILRDIAGRILLVAEDIKPQ